MIFFIDIILKEVACSSFNGQQLVCLTILLYQVPSATSNITLYQIFSPTHHYCYSITIPQTLPCLSFNHRVWVYLARLYHKQKRDMYLNYSKRTYVYTLGQCLNLVQWSIWQWLKTFFDHTNPTCQWKVFTKAFVSIT